MQFTALYRDDDAVSPVIGVILMVAITVILAAVIGTFVLGLGGEIRSNPPQAQFTFDEASNEDLTITHDGGDKVDVGNMNVTGSDSSTSITACQSNSGTTVWPATELTAGDSCTVPNGQLDSGETIRVTWESDDGSSSGTLATYEYDS